MAMNSTQAEAVHTAYVYLLSRALVARQEQLDIAEDGMSYNVLKHNPVGNPIDWVNPNLDVTNSEAWIAVDQSTPVLLKIPHIEDRYYTVQILDEWGEVITNINERGYPNHPNGAFTFTAPHSSAEIPPGSIRITLRTGKAKLLARIELASDPETAIALQHQITLNSPGDPEIAPPVPLPLFDNASLLGVELFDCAAELLDSAPDASPIAARMQSIVQDVVAGLADPSKRTEMDTYIRTQLVPAFRQYSVQEAGAKGNNWIATTVTGSYGQDVAVRSAANYVGIWANTPEEVIYFVTARDADGDPLDGSKAYLMEFPADQLPDDVVNAYWSLSLVDVPGFVAVPNRLNRYTFNSVAPPPSEPEGSLRIYLAPEAREPMPEANWLPTPPGRPFSLTFRAYVPKDIPKKGLWFPPAPRLI